MKKTAALILCISLLTASLASCGKNDFMSITEFTDNLNRNSADEISMLSYFLNNDVYYLPFASGEESILLGAVTQENGYIEQIRITAAKQNDKGEENPVTVKRMELFLNVCKRTIMAYSHFSEDEVDSIISELKLENPVSYKTESEHTLTRGNMHFVYYSTDISSMLMISNIHLMPVEKTEKPESRQFFGNTTNIRTETVPLR